MEMRKLGSIVLAAFLATASPAIAEETGTMGMAPSGEWAKTLADHEMAELRGGFRGFAFSAALSVFIENLQGDLVGSTVTNGTTLTATSPSSQTSFSVANGQVSISTYVGGVQDFSGVLNVVSVPGSFNVVNSILDIRVALVTVANGAQVPNLQQLFGQ